MSENIDKERTLLGVLEEYRIEIPIIQRDYAQGRPGRKEIREKLLDYMLKTLAGDGKAELDFVYGYEKDNSPGVFIPVDGQQRLTTLWLLHWYLGLKSGKLPEILPLLKKFTYQTRPSSKDFLERLCDEGQRLNPEGKLKQQIVDESAWFAESWLLDTSISGFITMLDAIAAHQVIQSNDAAKLLKRLQEKAVVFYFLRLENFSLGEEIYTRMNARGKVLSDFETFKSRFFKISRRFSNIHKEIARKIDGEWVEKLWGYKIDKEKVEKLLPHDIALLMDSAFLNYINFLTKMLYHETPGKVSDAETQSQSESKDFLDTEAIEEIFGKSESNLEFLIHAFDCLPILAHLAKGVNFDWKKPGLEALLRQIIDGDISTSVHDEIYVFAALLFLKKYPAKDGQPPQGIDDFLRVVRNLLGNTPDRAFRYWPNIIRSIRSLLKQGESVYDVGSCLLNPALSLTGFRVEQQAAEIFKARLEKAQPEAVPILQEIDENPYIRGRITRLIQTVCNSEEDLAKIKPEEVDLDALRGLYEAYCAMETYNHAKEYDGGWGELLNSSMYDDKATLFYNISGNKVIVNRCICNPKYNEYDSWEIHPALMKFAKEVQRAGGDPGKAALERERSFIRSLMQEKEGNLCATTDPKEQLYLLYIYTLRILKKEWSDFFVNRDRKYMNFAWLSNKPDSHGRKYTMPFEKTANKEGQIFQSYRQYFSSGILEHNTPVVLRGDGYTEFNKELIDFANEED